MILVDSKILIVGGIRRVTICFAVNPVVKQIDDGSTGTDALNRMVSNCSLSNYGQAKGARYNNRKSDKEGNRFLGAPPPVSFFYIRSHP